jgi:hypothetical protein
MIGVAGKVWRLRLSSYETQALNYHVTVPEKGRSNLPSIFCQSSKVVRNSVVSFSDVERNVMQMG